MYKLKLTSVPYINFKTHFMYLTNSKLHYIRKCQNTHNQAEAFSSFDTEATEGKCGC